MKKDIFVEFSKENGRNVSTKISKIKKYRLYKDRVEKRIETVNGKIDNLKEKISSCNLTINSCSKNDKIDKKNLIISKKFFMERLEDYISKQISLKENDQVNQIDSHNELFADICEIDFTIGTIKDRIEKWETIETKSKGNLEKLKADLKMYERRLKVLKKYIKELDKRIQEQQKGIQESTYQLGQFYKQAAYCAKVKVKSK